MSSSESASAAATSSDATRSRLRPLFPAPLRRDPPQPDAAGAVTKSKRSPIAASCKFCRILKAKCDGKRPECSRCITRLTECRYDTLPTETHAQALKRKFDQLQNKGECYEELYNYLRSGADADAQLIFYKVRTGVDVETILRQVKDGDLLLQLTLVPETETRYEFPYVAEMPSFLQIPDNLYLGSLIYQETLWSSKPSPRSNWFQTAYLKPYHAAELMDPQLSGATPSKWTSVSSNDALLRKLLEAYFLHDYPWCPPFQKDSFLHDMNRGRNRFCSSLLVNAILAVAYHCHRGFTDRFQHWSPQRLGYQFLAEARRLWDLESGRNSLPTIQAGILICVAYSLHGADNVGSSYLAQAIRMAHETNLFAESNLKSKRMRNARALTAWSLFSAQAIQSFTIMKPPLLSKPPMMPLPDPSSKRDFYGEMWIKYPLDERFCPTHFGHIFRSLCKLRVILNDISADLFGNAESSRNPSWSQTLQHSERLQVWYTALPAIFSPKLIVLPAHFKIHLDYFGALIVLFRRHISPAGTSPVDNCAAEHSHTAQMIVDDAKIRLETLIRLYYLRHGFKWHDPNLVQYLTLLGGAALNNIRTLGKQPATSTSTADLTALRSTLLLCLKGLHDQGKNFYLSRVVLRLLRDRMTQEDLVLFGKYVTLNEPEEEDGYDMAEYVQGQWVLPLFLDAGEDPEHSRLENLVTAYRRVSLEDASDAYDSS